MKRIIVFIFALLHISQTLCAQATTLQCSPRWNPHVQDSCLYQVDKTLYYMLLDSHNILLNNLHPAFNGLLNRILAETSQSLGVPLATLGTINTKILVLHAGDIVPYYANKEIADAFNQELIHKSAFALIHLYLYALSRYNDPHQRMSFYKLITKNYPLSGVIFNYEHDFEEIILKEFGELLGSPCSQSNHPKNLSQQ